MPEDETKIPVTQEGRKEDKEAKVTNVGETEEVVGATRTDIEKQPIEGEEKLVLPKEIIDQIDSGKFRFFVLIKDIDVKLHSLLTLKLIEVKDIRAVALLIRNLQDLNQTVALKLIEAGAGRAVARNLKNFQGLDHNAIAIKLIEAGEGRSVAEYLKNFQGLDHNAIVLKLIEAGKSLAVSQNFKNFQGLDHNAIALKMIEAGECMAVAYNLEKFQGLNQTIALKLIEAGNGSVVARHFENFQDLGQAVALKLIEAEEGEAVAKYIQNFQDLDHNEIALKLIEAGKGLAVARHLENFQDLGQAVALKLIEVGEGGAVAECLKNFQGLDQHEVVDKLIEAGRGVYVAEYLQDFQGLNHNDIALKLIEAGEGEAVAGYLGNFDGLDSQGKTVVMAKLAEKNPSIAFKYVDLYKDLVNLDEFIPVGMGKYIQNLSGASEEVARKQAKEILVVCKGVEEQFGIELGRLNMVLEKTPELWNGLVYPTIMSQKTGAFLCLNDIYSFYEHENMAGLAFLAGQSDQMAGLDDKNVTDLLKFITTQLGIKAHDILKNFILAGLREGKIKDLKEESELIQDFLKEGAIPLTEIYGGYKAAKQQGRSELYQEIVTITKAIQERVANGECDKEDINNRFFPGIVMYTFPPSIGVEREQYHNLIQYREDRQTDVPEELEEFQGKTITVSQGGYRLKEGEDFSDKAWQDLLTVVRESKETEAKAVEKADLAMLGRGLMNKLAEKKLKGVRKEYLKALYDVYRSRGNFLPDSLSGHKELMAYKEYVGDHLNDIIGLCVKAWQEQYPEEFGVWMKKEQAKRSKNIKGLVKRVSGVIENEKMDEDKKAEVLKEILKRADFRVEGDLLEVLSRELENGTLADFLVGKMETGSSTQKYNLLIKNALLGKEYSQMFEEMQKYEFEEGAGQEDYQLFVTKKKEHGCAGLNMGVCVAPDEQLWENSNFMNVVVMKDNIAYGGMHFLVMEEEGKKYLTLPGINPNEALLGQVAADDLFDEMMDYAKQCAKAMGCEKVLIPTASEIHSNRSAIQQVIVNKNYPPFTFDKEMPFSYDPYEYSFQDCYEVN